MPSNLDNISDEELDAMVAQKISASQVAQNVSVKASSANELNNLSDEELDLMVADKISREPSQFPVNVLPLDQGVIPEGQPIQKKIRRIPVENKDGRIVAYREMDDDDNSGQAFLEGAGNSIAMGYLPQLQAATYPLMEKGLNFVTGNDVQSDESYTQLRDENIARQEKQIQQNPGAALGGMIAGAGVTAPLGAAAAKGIGLVSKLGNFGSAAATGAGYGVLSNPGDTEGEVNPIQLYERGENAAKGGFVGLGVQGLGQGIARTGEAIAKSPEVAKKISSAAALKAAGAIGKDFKKLFGQNSADDIGETLLNNKIVQAGDTVEDIAKKAASAKSSTGKEIGEIYKRVNEELTKPEVIAKLSPKNKALLDITDIKGEKLADISMKKIERSLKNNLAAPEVKKLVMNTLDELKEKKSISIIDAQEMKVNLDKMINYNKSVKDMPELQKELKTVRDVLNKSIQNRVRVLGRVTEDKELINQLKEANKKFGHYSKAEAIASNRAKEIEGHRYFSLTETITGGTGATIGAMTGDTPEERIKNALMGAVAGVALKKADKFATPIVANNAKRLGRLLKVPANMEKFGAPIIEAAKKSPEEFQAFWNKLQTDPGFQKLLKPQGAK